MCLKREMMKPSMSEKTPQIFLMINHVTICLNTNSMAWIDFSLHYKGTMMTLKIQTDTTAPNFIKKQSWNTSGYFHMLSFIMWMLNEKYITDAMRLFNCFINKITVEWYIKLRQKSYCLENEWFVPNRS